MEITRFAPSPTGFLHLGHAFAAMYAYRAATTNGKFLLRIEDIDLYRCKKIYEENIYIDLDWLGIKWEKPVLKQTNNKKEYSEAIYELDKLGLVYPCFCSRSKVNKEISYSLSAPQSKIYKTYSGRCRSLSSKEIEERKKNNEKFCLRLNMTKAIDYCGKSLTFFEKKLGEVKINPSIFGDIILSRKDINTSYHLSVTIDDSTQGISLVTRGKDLFESTYIHRLLQCLLNLSTPKYDHHNLILDNNGKKLSKRDSSISIKSIRETGKPSKEIIEKLIKY